MSCVVCLDGVSSVDHVARWHCSARARFTNTFIANLITMHWQCCWSASASFVLVALAPPVVASLSQAKLSAVPVKRHRKQRKIKLPRHVDNRVRLVASSFLLIQQEVESKCTCGHCLARFSIHLWNSCEHDVTREVFRRCLCRSFFSRPRPSLTRLDINAAINCPVATDPLSECHAMSTSSDAVARHCDFCPGVRIANACWKVPVGKTMSPVFHVYLSLGRSSSSAEMASSVQTSARPP